MITPAALCTTLFLMTAVGCASSRTRPQGNVAGTYRFTERIDAAIPPVTLEGTVVVAGGEVDLDLVSYPCRYDERSTTRTAVFECMDVTISVDRQIPTTGALYRLRTMIRHAVRECVQYQILATGERRCVRYETRYEERQGTRSGRLNLVRMGA